MNILEQIKSGQDFTVTWNYNMGDVMRNASFDTNIIDGSIELNITIATATQQIELIREFGFTIFAEDGKSQGMGFTPIDGLEWQTLEGDESLAQSVVKHILETKPALLNPEYSNLSTEDLAILDNEIAAYMVLMQ